MTRRLVVVASMLAVASCSLPLSWAQTQKSTKETRASADSQPSAKLQPLNV